MPPAPIVVKEKQPVIVPAPEKSVRIEAVPPTPTSEFRERTAPPISLLEKFLTLVPRPVLLGGIAVIGATFGIMSALSYVDTKNAGPAEFEVAVTESQIRELVRADGTRSVSLTTDRQSLLLSLQKTVSELQGESEIIHLTKEDGKEATAKEFLSVLSPRAPQTFVRALHSEYTFGSVRGTAPAPFLVLHVPNFDVGFGGMLAWEKTMSEDLSPLFGTPVRETLAPQSTSPKGPHFTDAIQSNNRIRILYDEVGNERLMYAFVNDAYIIITTNTDALQVIISRLSLGQ
jgi:hypothetical protein